MIIYSAFAKSCPNGRKATWAILKYCLPNGMPMIVIHRIAPVKKNPSAVSHPPKIAQRIFTNVLKPLGFAGTTTLPNGQMTNFENLKYCKPIGIKMIVIQRMSPIKKSMIDQNKPPKITHKILPNVFIKSSLFSNYNSKTPLFKE